MPHRGRDTVYVESLIAWFNIAAGLVCILVQPPVWETNILTLFVSIAPIELLAFVWLGVGAAQTYGCLTRNLKFVEYGALCSAGLWLVVCVNLIRTRPSLFPMTCIYAPTLTIYSFLIYRYQEKTVAYHGRTAKAIRG